MQTEQTPLEIAKSHLGTRYRAKNITSGLSELACAYLNGEITNTQVLAGLGGDKPKSTNYLFYLTVAMRHGIEMGWVKRVEYIGEKK